MKNLFSLDITAANVCSRVLLNFEYSCCVVWFRRIRISFEKFAPKGKEEADLVFHCLDWFWFHYSH